MDLVERKIDCIVNNKSDYFNCNFMVIRVKSYEIFNYKKIKKNLKELLFE